MQAIQAHFRDAGRDPTDVELETLAQTWSEHCSHKTLKGQHRLRGPAHRQPAQGDDLRRDPANLASSSAPTTGASASSRTTPASCASTTTTTSASRSRRTTIRRRSSPTAAPTPASAASSAIRSAPAWVPGRSATPTCFASPRPTRRRSDLPAGVLHPRKVMQGVVAGVRDYGNRMGIPTVNGAICFDERYLGNPLVFCGTVGLLPVDKSSKQPMPGDLIVAVGGRTGRDGVHGATFSSIELTSESEQSLRRRRADRQRHHREEAARRAAASARSRPVSRDHRLRRRRLQLRRRRDGREDRRGRAARSRAAEI